MIEFRGGEGRHRHEVQKRVTLDPKNVLYLSGRVVEMLGSPEAVTLQFDPHKQIIGLTPARPTRANAFRLKRREGGRGRAMNIRPFCKHFDIKILRTVAFNTIEVDPETGTMLLDLTDTTLIGRPPGSLKGRT